MVESNHLSRAEQDAIASAPLMAELLGPIRSGRSTKLIAQKTSFIAPNDGWMAGKTVRPPTSEFSTLGGDNDDKNDYYTRLEWHYRISDAHAWIPDVGDYCYCTQTKAAFLCTVDGVYDPTDTDAHYQNWTILPVVRVLTPNASWSAGLPAVGSLITVASTNRAAGAPQMTGFVVDTSNPVISSVTYDEVIIAITNGVNICEADELTNGTTVYTIDIAGGDLVSEPYALFPGQKLSWSGSETTPWALGNLVSGSVSGSGGICTAYNNNANWLNVLPDNNEEFVVGDVVTNLNSLSVTAALTAAAWDTIVDRATPANTLVLSKAKLSDDKRKIIERTLGSILIPDRLDKPTVRACGMGMHWPFQSVGAMTQERSEQQITVSAGTWNVNDLVSATDGDTTVYGKLSAVAGTTLTIVPIASLVRMSKFEVGYDISNDTAPTAPATISTHIWGTSVNSYNYLPAARETIGVNEWRRFIHLAPGMMGRRGGGVKLLFHGSIRSVPGADTNYLDILLIPDWQYPNSITNSARDTGEHGGLRGLPSSRIIGWRIPIPATVSQSGLFSLEIVGVPVHPQTQMWSGSIIISSTVNTEFVDSAAVPIVDKRLEPIYRSFVSSTHTPETEDYDLAFLFKVDGTAGATPAQPYNAVGRSTIPQDGSRIWCKILQGRAEYMEAD